MPVGAVIRNEVRYDAHAALVGLPYQALDVIERAEPRIHLEEVRYMIAVIGACLVER